MSVRYNVKYVHCGMCVLLFLGSAMSTCSAAELQAIPDAEPIFNIESLQGGGYRAQASIQIRADKEQVWQVLTDCAEALKYVPGMRKCELIERTESYDIASHRIRRGWLLPGLEYRFRSDYMPYQRIQVKLLSGDLRLLQGEWRFTPCGEACTVLSYDFSVEARWYVPARAERRALTEDVPEMLHRLKDQAEASHQHAAAGR